MITLLALGACRMDLAPGWRIDGARVLGARIEVEGSPDTSEPRRGDAARVTFLVAAPPDESPALSWAFLSCVAAPTRGAAALCAGPPLSEIQRGTGPARVAIGADAVAAAEGTGSLLVLGAVCANGEPIVQNGAPGCSAGAVGETILTLQVPIARNVPPNRNPDLARFDALFAGQYWGVEPGDVAPTGCAALEATEALPRVALTSEAGTSARPVVFVIDEEEREEIAGGARERMQISTFVSAGELSRQFSIVEGALPEAPRPQRLTWKPPPAAALATEGDLVRFWFVVRDGRGGFSYTTRAVCVVP